MQHFGTFLSKLTASAIKKQFLVKLSPAHVDIMARSVFTGIEPQAKSFHGHVLSLVQAMYDDTFVVEKETVSDAVGVFVTGMDHFNKDIKSKTVQLWKSTFGKDLKEEDVPNDIQKLLAKATLAASSDSFGSGSQNSSQSSQPQPNSLLNFAGVFAATKKSEGSKQAAATPEKGRVVAVKPSSPFAKPKTPSKKPTALEDEDSQMFVKITSPANRKRVLTDHQKDRMTSSRSDIPALYSELSRDDSIGLVDLPAEFQSQNSLSSQEVGNGTNVDDSAVNGAGQSPSPEKQPPEEVVATSVETSQEPVAATVTAPSPVRRRKSASPKKKALIPALGKKTSLRLTRSNSFEQKQKQTSSPGKKVSKSDSKVSTGKSVTVNLSPVKILQENAHLAKIKMPPSIEAKEKENVLTGNKRKPEPAQVQSPASKRPRRSVRSVYARASQDSESSQPTAEPLVNGGGVSSNRATSGKSNKYGETPLHVAARKGEVDKITTLLKEKGQFLSTQFHFIINHQT